VGVDIRRSNFRDQDLTEEETEAREETVGRREVDTVNATGREPTEVAIEVSVEGIAIVQRATERGGIEVTEEREVTGAREGIEVDSVDVTDSVGQVNEDDTGELDIVGDSVMVRQVHLVRQVERRRVHLVMDIKASQVARTISLLEQRKKTTDGNMKSRIVIGREMESDVTEMIDVGRMIEIAVIVVQSGGDINVLLVIHLHLI